jgi:hypothetical protein
MQHSFLARRQLEALSKKFLRQLRFGWTRKVVGYVRIEHAALQERQTNRIPNDATYERRLWLKGKSNNWAQWANELSPQIWLERNNPTVFGRVDRRQTGNSTGTNWEQTMPE